MNRNRNQDEVSSGDRSNLGENLENESTRRPGQGGMGSSSGRRSGSEEGNSGVTGDRSSKGDRSSGGSDIGGGSSQGRH